MATKIVPTGTKHPNRLGNILADAATLSDSDMGVLQVWLRGFRAGLEMNTDSLRTASDAEVRSLVNGRTSA